MTLKIEDVSGDLSDTFIMYLLGIRFKVKLDIFCSSESIFCSVSVYINLTKNHKAK